jgi:hypothetical protein
MAAVIVSSPSPPPQTFVIDSKIYQSQNHPERVGRNSLAAGSYRMLF